MALREELDHVLGPEGEIAANHPFYEHRPGQIRMAQAGHHHGLAFELASGSR